MSETSILIEKQYSVCEPQEQPQSDSDVAKENVHARGRWESQHLVDFRLSVPLLFKRYYVTILAGEERRGPERLAAMSQIHPINSAGNRSASFAAGTFLGICLCIFVLLVGRWIIMETGWIQP